MVVPGLKSTKSPPFLPIDNQKSTGENSHAATRSRNSRSQQWWAQRDSNPRHLPCKRRKNSLIPLDKIRLSHDRNQLMPGLSHLSTSGTAGHTSTGSISEPPSTMHLSESERGACNLGQDPKPFAQQPDREVSRYANEADCQITLPRTLNHSSGIRLRHQSRLVTSPQCGHTSPSSIVIAHVLSITATQATACDTCRAAI
jgi:hypothetical protein